MRRYVKDLKPTEVRDLAAMVALFRPGPMANIPAYIRRKHGEEPVTYLHESLEPALRDTYGIFVYQEDIMTAAIAMADYTGPEADNLCYAIRKKKESVLREHEAKFKAGAKKKGIPRVGGGPGVRRLRALRPLRVQQGPRHLLRADRVPDRLPQGELPGRVHDRGAQRFPGARREGRGGGRRVPAAGDRGPAAGRPGLAALFTVEDDADGVPEAIRFGLAAIKNVGEGAIEAIVAAREGRSETSDATGPFTHLDDLCRRVDLRTVNKRVARVAHQGRRDAARSGRRARC